MARTSKEKIENEKRILGFSKQIKRERCDSRYFMDLEADDDEEDEDEEDEADDEEYYL